jgi:hypothetical protein
MISGLIKRHILVAAAVILLVAQTARSECIWYPQVPCVWLEFVEELPPVAGNSYGKDRCQAKMSVFNTPELFPDTINVVFPAKFKCPHKGERRPGGVRRLCQDVGRWTLADYEFEVTQDKCLSMNIDREHAIQNARQKINKMIVLKDYSEKIERVISENSVRWLVTYKKLGQNVKGGAIFVSVDVKSGLATVTAGE